MDLNESKWRLVSKAAMGIHEQAHRHTADGHWEHMDTIIIWNWVLAERKAFEVLLPPKGQVGVVGFVSFCFDQLLKLTWSTIIPLFVDYSSGDQLGQPILTVAAKSNLSACDVQV